MATLKLQCPICKKDAKLKYETPFGKKMLRVFLCGHSMFTEEDSPATPVQEAPPEPTLEEINALLEKYESQLESQFETDGGGQVVDFIDPSFFSLDYEHRAYEFQQQGVKFAEHANFNCLIADDMGLGKTIQALLVLKRNRAKLTPTLIVVKGATTLQWCKEFKKWVDNNPIGIMPLVNRESIIPGFQFYVISMDFISRKGVLERLLKLKLKSIILDECQAYKDQSTNRTDALFKLIKKAEIKYKIGLSGTPIKNKAIEYFPILNLLDPSRFYTKVGFARTYLVQNERGVYSRLNPQMEAYFRQVTSKYIIRREKREVLKNLPPLRRDFILVEIEDPEIKQLYNAEIDLMQNFLKTNKNGKVNSTVLLGWLAKMRAIAGQAKVPWAMDYIQEAMDNTDDSLAVGIHHHSVRDTLYLASKAMGYDPLKLSGEDSLWIKDKVQTDFNEGRNRLLIINALAGGVGLNLQKACHHAVVLERLWNSADEAQFECRFDRDGQKYPVEVKYPMAVGTIDEWFHELVSAKRKDFHRTMGDTLADVAIEQDEQFIQTLVERTLANRL